MQILQRFKAFASKSNARPKGITKQPAKQRAKKSAKQPSQAVSEQQPSVSQTADSVHQAEATRVVSIEKVNGFMNTSLGTVPSKDTQPGDLTKSNVESGHIQPRGSQDLAEQLPSGFLPSAPVSAAHAVNPPAPTKVTKKTKGKQADKAQLVDEAEAAGLPIPPSQRRMITLSANDPRVIQKDDGPCAPPPDDYNSKSFSFFPLVPPNIRY
jgi:hypothetical protein